MDFVGNKPRTNWASTTPFRTKLKIEYADDADVAHKYRFNLSFYSEPPGLDCTISLKDFEDYAVARLKLLRTIEKINLTSVTKYSAEWRQKIDKELETLKLDDYRILGCFPIKGETSEEEKARRIVEARKFDHISHYIFRLAFCRNDELKRSLIAMELDYFNFKYMGKTDNTSFLESKVDLLKVKNKKKLQEEYGGLLDGDYYDVDFRDVIDLVRTRRVILQKGRAFVPYKELLVVITARFRKELSNSLSQTAQIMPAVLEDERLSKVLTDFDKRYTGTAYKKKDNESFVTAEMLPELSKKSFPLCMKGLHDVVEKEHHLKHFGRLQLGLFFKAVGLPLDESIIYWRNHFTKKAGVDGTRFDKQYLYNIRHMYGKEGRRADYTPYNCMKIITGSVGPGEHHGCPFRHSDATPLREKLVAANIGAQGITDILDLVKNKHYQIACQKYFEFTHDNATVEGGIQHPNQYFDESQNASLGLLRKAKAPVKSTRSTVYGEKITPTPKPKTNFPWSDDEDDEAFVEAASQMDQDSETQVPMEASPIIPEGESDEAISLTENPPVLEAEAEPSSS